MSARPPGSLQARLLGLVFGVVAVVWLAASVATWIDVRQELDELLDGHLAQAAALLVVQQAGEIHNDDDADGAPDAPTLHRYAPKVAFQVFHEGRLALRSANAPAEPMADPGGDFKSGLRTVPLAGEPWRVFAAYGAERDVQVYVGEAIASRSSILWAVMRSTAWPMAVALPLLMLAAWWAIRRGLVPLRRLGDLLAERQPASLQPVVVDRAPAEIAPITEALNGLFERIGQLMASERRFTADAAHELRTPIAAIRAQAQVAMAEPDAGLRRHALQATLAGCDRAARLVEQLLTLARVESAGPPALGPVDLDAIVRQVVAEIAERSAAKQQVLTFESAGACPFQGEPTLLAVLVRNLVDNAIRYSPVGAQVRITLVAPHEGRGLGLRIEDSGPGLAAPELARLGERFFRVNSGQPESGSGLGWSIVRRIAAAHRMGISLGASPDLAGLSVEITAGQGSG